MAELMEAERTDAAEAELQKLLWVCYLTGFTPHPGQVRALQAVATARFAGIWAGRRWGKSQLLARLAVRAAMDPGKVIWCVAPYLELTKRVFRPVRNILMHGLPRKLAECGMAPLKVVRAIDSSSERYLELSNRSLIQAKSCDNKDSLLGEGVDLCLLDESERMSQEIWESYLMPSLLDRNGRAVHASTPMGFTWGYDNFLRGQDGPQRSPEWATIQSPSWENPFLPPEIVERFRSLMSRSSFDQEIAAKFTARSGRVFGDFDRETHVRPCPMDWTLPAFLGVDFGYRTFAFVAAQVHGQELRIFADGELHEATTAQAIAKIRAHPWARQIRAIFCDPAGTSRNLQTGRADVDVLRDGFPGVRISYSYHPEHRNPEWRAARLRDRLLSVSGEIRLFVDPAARCIIRMFESSCYPDGAKDEPVKDGVVDHIRDALGYLEACQFHKGESQILGRRPGGFSWGRW